MLLRSALFYLPALLLSLGVEAQGTACEEQARTPLERTYCKIRAANPSAVLPSLQELRRNPEKTQRLLLRRPAEQAGISLPPEARRPVAPAASPQRAASKPALPKPDAQIEPARTEAPAASTTSLSGCELRSDSIRCGAERYQLQGNLPNSRLAPGALDEAQRVVFAEYRGDTTNRSALMEYASRAYLQYIEAMLAIGLGASTMSFTKFYHTFTDAQAKGARFGERLTSMFDFLKKDKASMGVQTHYNDALPDSLAQCMRLSDLVLVCDNVQQNWVYRRTVL